MPVSPFDPFGSVPTMEEALNRFQQGLEGLTFQRAIDEASQRVNKIRESESDIIKQRQAIQSVANDLTLSLLGKGIDLNKIGAVAKTIAPDQDMSAEGLFRQGLAAGEEGAPLKELARQQQQFENRPKLEQIAAAQQADIVKERVRGEEQRKTQASLINPNQGPELKPIDQADADKLSVLISSARELHSIIKEAPKYGGYLGPQRRLPGISTLADLAANVSNPEAASFLARLGQVADQYRLAITGAGASEKEIRILESRMPQATDTVPTLIKKAQSALQMGDSKLKTKLSTLGRNQKDISMFREALRPGFLNKSQEVDRFLDIIPTESVEQQQQVPSWQRFVK